MPCHRAAGAPPREGTNGTSDGAHGFTGFRGGKVGTPSPWRTAGAKRRHDSSQTSRKCAASFALLSCNARRYLSSMGDAAVIRGPDASRATRMHAARPGAEDTDSSRDDAVPSAPAPSLLRSALLQCMPFAQLTSVGAGRGPDRRERAHTTPSTAVVLLQSQTARELDLP